MMNYILDERGNSNIFISAPHGGSKKPYNLPIRKYGTLLKDTGSKEVAQNVISNLYKPYYTISNIHRSRLDLNRKLSEGANGNADAEKIWREWNTIVSRFCSDITNKYGKGLYIEIHSHNNNDCIQLGYNLDKEDYLNLLNGVNSVRPSSISSLGFSNYEMIFGKYSIGSTLEGYGYKIYKPTKGEIYFNGGRNIQVFGRRGIGAIQIELPTKLLKRDKIKIAKVLSESILIFRDNFAKEN